MLTVIYGETNNRPIAEQIATAIEPLSLEGSLYFGYPVLATADAPITLDGLLVSKQHGIVALQFFNAATPPTDQSQWNKISDDLDRVYVAFENNLRRYDDLRLKRGLGVTITARYVFPSNPHPPSYLDQDSFVGVDELVNSITQLDPVSEELWRPLRSALERVSTIRPRKRRENVKTDSSKGAKLKIIERQIANLDQWQKEAAISTTEGPQRVRGLAGSGKTIVLALKAAYLHAQHRDWNIVVTFHSRSLYQQFEDLIRRFTFEHISDEPDWTKLRILHSWGSSARQGVYKDIAAQVNSVFRDFLFGRTMYGYDGAFGGVCEELLSITANSDPEPVYDAVLVDEAQDLPPSFFKLLHRFTKPPKRIIYAYDDLQKLSEAAMPSTTEMFGMDSDGTPIVEHPQHDIILPVCYRNPPWLLATAHALGLGVYREGGLVQHFDDPNIWPDIGYEIVTGDLSEGSDVTLRRKTSSSPSYFEGLLDPEESVQFHKFGDRTEQAGWIADDIVRNLKHEEIEPDDILVVLPEAYTAKKDAVPIMEALSRRGLESHLVGSTSSTDVMFAKDSIALAHIHRSKGNEAPVVYVADSQKCMGRYGQIAKRNTLFTAITRSKAWVNICAWGPRSGDLKEEVDRIISSEYQLKFTIPTAENLERMRQIHRELTAEERSKATRAERGLREFLRGLNQGDLSLDNLPRSLRKDLLELTSKSGTEALLDDVGDEEILYDEESDTE